MANEQNLSRSQLIQLVREKAEDEMRQCDHKPRNGKNKLMLLSNYTGDLISERAKAKYPDTAVICTECGAIFEPNSFTDAELKSSIYMFESVLHQIKLNSLLNDEDWKDLMASFRAIDHFDAIRKFYDDMVNKLTGGKKQGNGNKGSAKGQIGTSSGDFGRRPF